MLTDPFSPFGKAAKSTLPMGEEEEEEVDRPNSPQSESKSTAEGKRINDERFLDEINLGMLDAFCLESLAINIVRTALICIGVRFYGHAYDDDPLSRFFTFPPQSINRFRPLINCIRDKLIYLPAS